MCVRVLLDTDGLNPPPAKVCSKHASQSHVHTHHKHTDVTNRTWANRLTAASTRRSRRPVFKANVSP